MVPVDAGIWDLALDEEFGEFEESLDNESEHSQIYWTSGARRERRKSSILD